MRLFPNSVIQEFCLTRSSSLCRYCDPVTIPTIERISEITETTGNKPNVTQLQVSAPSGFKRGSARRSTSHEFASIKSGNQHPIPARHRRIAGFSRRSGDCFPCRIAFSAKRFCGGGRFFRSFRLSNYKPSDAGDFFVGHSEFCAILCATRTAFASGGDHDGFGCLRR